MIGKNDKIRPEHVGILSFEFYFPPLYVDQDSLEKYDNVSEGKYTVGLGQKKMGFCSDREDVNSLSLTVVQHLLEKNKIDPKIIGRLEVGTETLIDKSKSVKTVLMQLFEDVNTDIEGVDNVNACYGGTSALFNAVNWIESSSWDGRFAIVVTCDIAVYPPGNARPTGGAGAVAMLIGPNAPIYLEKGLKTSYMRHSYDFYKPVLNSEYPIVDSKLSIECYLTALDECYERFCNKADYIMSENLNFPFGLKDLDAVLFHSPYYKLVQKSLARLFLIDIIRMPKANLLNNDPELEPFRSVKLKESYFDKELEKKMMAFSHNDFLIKTAPSLHFSQNIGNMYTSSLYANLISYLLNTSIDHLLGSRIVLFSYGSGLAATLFSLKVASDNTATSPLCKMLQNMNTILYQFEDRICASPEMFVQILKIPPYQPVGEVDVLFPGTWYLEKVDDKYRRSYKRKQK